MEKNSNIFTLGSNIYGQLGADKSLGESRKFVKISFIDKQEADSSLKNSSVVAKKIACGTSHTIILTDSGQVYSWGCNQNAALGRGGDEIVPGLVEIPNIPLNINFAKKKGVTAAGGSRDYIVQIACTESGSFVLTEGGMLFGWGVFCDKSAPIGFLKRKIERIGNLSELHKAVKSNENSKGARPFRTDSIVMGRKIVKPSKPKSKKPETARSLKKGVLTPVAQAVKRPVLLADHVLDFSTGKNHLVYKTLDGIFCIGTNMYGESGFQPQKRKSTLEHLVPCLLANKRSLLYKYDYLYCGPYTTYFINGQEITAFGKNTDGQLGLGNFISGSMRRKTYLSIETDKLIIKDEKELERNKFEIVDKIFYTEHSRIAQKTKKLERILRNKSHDIAENKMSDQEKMSKEGPGSKVSDLEFQKGLEHINKNIEQKLKKSKTGGKLDHKKTIQLDDSEEEIDFKVNGVEVESKKTIKHETITKIACGESHTLFLTAIGNVYGTGSNDLKQLGSHIERKKFNDPKLIANNMIDIKVNGFHTFLKSKNGIWHSLGLKKGEMPVNELNDLCMKQKVINIELGHDFMVVMSENLSFDDK